MPITHIHDWSLYRFFTSLLHIYMTDPFTVITSLLHIYMTGPFTGYLHPYYTFTWLVPLLVIYIPITHITWPVSLLVIYIPITHIHDWSLYWLFTSLLHIYMSSPFTGYLQSLLHILHDRSLYWLFTSLLHIYMTDPFIGYLHPYYTFTWLIP